MLKLKFTYSEKATKFCKISTFLLSYVVPVKSKVEILQNFVAFSEYMNFNTKNFNFTSLFPLSLLFKFKFWLVGNSKLDWFLSTDIMRGADF